MPRAARLVASIACAIALAGLSVSARADGITREAALKALLARVDLPLSRAVFAQMMGEMRRYAPSAYVDSIGQRADLGDGWKAGVPEWDRARALVVARLDREDAAGSPVFAVTRLDVERSLDLPWTEDDIRFLDETIDTPLGQALVRLLDAAVTTGLVSGIVHEPDVPPDLRALLADVARKADTETREAVETLERLSADDPARAARLRSLPTDEAPGAMVRMANALFRPSTRRFGSLMADLTPELDALAAQYKARR